MVVATANTQETVHKDLKTLEGGWVKLRRLTWGEKLQRRAMVSGMKVKGSSGKGKKDDFEGEMNLVNEQATLFDFERCIVEHNLEAEVSGPRSVVEGEEPSNTRPLNFKSIADIKLLDPRVGEEIDTLISELNNFDEDELGEE